VIRILVHPIGETQSTHHMHPTLSRCMVPDHTYLTRSTHSNISRSRQQIWTDPLFLRRRARTQPTAHWLTSLWVCTQLLSQNIQWSSGEKPSFRWRQATRFTGPISLACDRYVQYILAGTNPSVLNQHLWGPQPWSCWLSISHSPTFPTDDPPLST
jgi:hypothetical protein